MRKSNFVKIYCYSSVTGIEEHACCSERVSGWISRPSGITRESLRVSQLDRSRDDGGNGYYTTPAKAVEAFIARGQAAPVERRAEWCKPLARARAVLKELLSEAPPSGV